MRLLGIDRIYGCLGYGAVSRKYSVAEPVDVAVFPLHTRLDTVCWEEGTE